MFETMLGLLVIWEERERKKKIKKKHRERDLRASCHHPASLHHQTTKTTTGKFY